MDLVDRLPKLVGTRVEYLTLGRLFLSLGLFLTVPHSHHIIFCLRDGNDLTAFQE